MEYIMVKGNSLKRLYELFNTDDAIEDYIFYICFDRGSDGFVMCTKHGGNNFTLFSFEEIKEYLTSEYIEDNLD